ncbi:MAG TPA: cell division protein ZapA [Zoogloea sp.]|uniref:cell division protein ZapA n=1 Tax=Zoogloea sp. TaxID=49181 RepID=UPI002D095A34|nr:cell division protein ZapA [Zoogloea sp.]HMV19014.1 cell division protein ZapA [Rhodocyclaceae bacterium]HMV63744.1 cell division protein ZapA [Rhodocyclaceae bacterium]HMW52018.1 cell division protein ZapA [Rhodocyclaceae bacterium]HMY50794.1 cell division protein ZapA [Rhodocyclaceae bacterium]HMZ76712.1 cell division protein ZapA [Rhodocyclaceae bacterium]
MEHLDIKLLGREYRVACKPEERDGLMAAVAYLDEKMRDLGAKTNSAGERLAVMTALNITHEFLQFQRAGGFDIQAVKRRIEHMNSRLDGVLAPQEKLF